MRCQVRPHVEIQTPCQGLKAEGVHQEQWSELQTAQNNSLQSAIGCVKQVSVDHLHLEAK